MSDNIVIEGYPLQFFLKGFNQHDLFCVIYGIFGFENRKTKQRLNNEKKSHNIA